NAACGVALACHSRMARALRRKRQLGDPIIVISRSTPPLLIAACALFFFSDLVRHPTAVLYSDHSDLLAEHVPAKRFLVRSWQETGELPLWCTYSFAGSPFVHDAQVAMFYPPYWPLFLLPEEPLGAGLSWASGR